MNQIYISNNAIEISGEGISVKEIKRVQWLFKKMFWVEPEIRIRGFFSKDAIKPEHTKGDQPDVWDLQATGMTYSVLLMGTIWLSVLLERGLGTVTVDPSKGRNVVVRFLMPVPASVPGPMSCCGRMSGHAESCYLSSHPVEIDRNGLRIGQCVTWTDRPGTVREFGGLATEYRGTPYAAVRVEFRDGTSQWLSALDLTVAESGASIRKRI